ncbi:Alpha/Beta hydrolase protein [Xylaria palmicola]|nr:Alpha/Beta hydrolase protein [Xylaria palmicola]
MERIGPGHIPRPKGKKDTLATPSAFSDARPWWSKVGGHLRNWRHVYVLIGLSLYCLSTIRTNYRRNHHEHTLYDGPVSGGTELWTEWLDIKPSDKLEWQSCFGIYGPNLQCARLTVPMDYSRLLNESADNPKVHLALMMVTGGGRTQDSSTYAETPLLVNPGGPGGSGVLFAQMRASSLQLLVGNHHDIIGFDPRGVGASTPKADCFVSPDSSNGVLGRNIAYMNRLTWATSGQEVGLVNSSNVALAKLRARSRAVAKLCERVDEIEGDASIFRHMSTPNSARDMLSIINAWNEWRSSNRTTKPMQSEAIRTTDKRPLSDNDENRKTSLQGKLVYWGFSYGTLLGATFASMFPDKVGRIVLDGVVHADHYVHPTWDRSIIDADAVWEKFFVYCAETGTLCSFYRTGDGPDDIKKRFLEIMSSLEEQPATVLLPDTNLPALITASDMKKSIFFAALYSPTVGFPVVAELLDHAFTGRLGELAKGAGLVSLCGNLTMPVWPDDAMKGIACSDKRHKLHENVTELQSRFRKAASFSWFADVWFGLEPNLGCNGWGIESKDPPMRWDDHTAHKPAPIETSFPILVLSNTLDPVTPLSDALAMTRKFANASIVEQDGMGHCSLSCVSGCTIAHLRAYLNEGIVPPPPKFKSDSSNEGRWPTCKCHERPWISVGYTAEKSTDGARLNGTYMQAYEDIRSQFAALTLSQQLDYNNPLKAYLVERSRLLR